MKWNGLFIFMTLCVSASVLAQQNAPTNSPAAKSADEPNGVNDDTNQSYVDAQYKLDTSSTTDFNLDGNFASKDKTHFAVGYEVTHSPPTPGQIDSVDTSEIRLGVGSEASSTFNFMVNYSWWGQIDQIYSSTFGVDLKWLGDNFISTITPQLRFISVPIEDDAVLKRILGTASPKNVVISDPSLAGILNFIGWDPWHFKARVAYYSYNRDLSTIFSSSLSRFFSSSAITSANNFNEVEASIEAGYAFRYVSLAFEYLYAISALDYSVNPSYTAKSTFTFIKDFDIELDAGETPGVGVDSPDVTFVDLGLTKYW